MKTTLTVIQGDMSFLALPVKAATCCSSLATLRKLCPKALGEAEDLGLKVPIAAFFQDSRLQCASDCSSRQVTLVEKACLVPHPRCGVVRF